MHIRRAVRVLALGLELQHRVPRLDILASGWVAAQKLLETDHPPTAIFASSDYMAAGVLKAASNLNISVPTQLSICGFDDNPIARYLTPTLTTMRHPVRKLAQQAGELLITRLKQNLETAEATPIQSELIVRESTGPI